MMSQLQERLQSHPGGNDLQKMILSMQSVSLGTFYIYKENKTKEENSSF
jgi:hypothetical protein